MDPDGDSQPTQQATQNVVDPRRLGKQNSGFSDDDISDIVCLLLPYSDSARREVSKIALRSSRHMVARDDADNVDIDYALEDDAERFELTPRSAGEHAIVLRLSADVKNPLQGFTFGRNASRCDICFTNDPHKRLSNIHFRIYLNEYGVLMLEDQSTNGTIVDGTLLRAKSRPREETKRTLTSGTKIQILMHAEGLDLEFLVRIPRREGEYERAYRENLISYMHRLQSMVDEEGETIAPGPTGHVDLFPVNEPTQGGRTTARPTRASPLKLLPETTQDNVERLPREWTGSNKYNRVGQIGKGAFATVYKVTSKFDGKPYAAKELDKRKFMKNGVLDQKVENEMNIMQKIEHPHIVSYIEHLDWDDRLFIIIMEYVPAGDLGRFITDRGPLPEITVKEMSRQLIDALGYLHTNNITHRDVKPDNILIQSHQPFYVKLTDFGLSKMVDNEQTFLRTFCGTLLYCAPEVYTEFAEYDEYGRRHPRNKHRRQPYGQRYDHAIDIWSLGGVIFYALTGLPPYPVKTGISYSELLHQIMTKKLDISPLVKQNVSADGIDFLTHMLQRRPEHRATVRELQGHPWLGGSKSSQSYDDFSEDHLGQRASQLSLQDPEQAQLIPESDDEIIEDDFYDENQFSDFESQKENYTFGQGGQPGKLFGEVNVSAIGSSGVIPSNRLNLPISADSFGATEILGSEVQDSFESEDSSTPRQKKKHHSQNGGVRLSSYPSHSVDELNNMTFDVESQSLGGAESILENLNMKSAARLTMPQSNANSFSTSKRKPSHDTSDEFDGPRTADKPTIKRLKSDTQMESLSDIENGEYELLAAIPPIARLHSGRQIDTPVHKSTYWNAQDKKTWHLRYPEMTQLQLNAFRAAAEARGEVFAPGLSIFWELAMSYFPPANDSEVHAEPPSPILDLSFGGAPLKMENDSPDSIPKESDLPPPTLGPDDHDPDSLPDTIPPDHNIIVPIPIDPPRNRVVATFKSSPGSAVAGVSIDITQSVTSWGRAADNTNVYPVKMDGKVPKYAFKLILWKDGYDPAKNFRPWNSTGVSPKDFAFYISTKATNGIQINGMVLQSYEPKKPAGPSKHWVRLYDGDVIVIWRTGTDASQAKLDFKCNWGASSTSRPPTGSTPPPVYVPESIAKRLDEACHRAEKRIGGIAEQELRIEAADAEFQERTKNIERERQRSKAFELKRTEACRFLSARASRRGSPGTGQPAGQGTTGPSHATGNATSSTINATTVAGSKMAPPFRHTSPSISRLQAMAKDD